jgi:hypothetical protein
MGLLGPVDTSLTTDQLSLSILGIDTIYVGHSYSHQITCDFSDTIEEIMASDSHTSGYLISNVIQSTTSPTITATYTFDVPYGHTQSSLVVCIPPVRVTLLSGVVVVPTRISINVRPEDTTVLSVRVPYEEWFGFLSVDRVAKTLTYPITFSRSLTDTDHPEQLFQLRAGDGVYPFGADSLYENNTTMVLKLTDDMVKLKHSDVDCILEMATYYRGSVEWVGYPKRFQMSTPFTILFQSAVDYGFEYAGKYRPSTSLRMKQSTESSSWPEMLRELEQSSTDYFAVEVDSLLANKSFFVSVPETPTGGQSMMAYDEFDLDYMDETIDYTFAFRRIDPLWPY